MSDICMSCDGYDLDDLVCVIVVPEQALVEAGYIQALHAEGTAQDKHGLHALAQTVYYQFQDDELEVVVRHEPCSISLGNERLELARGLLIFRDRNGTIGVWCHAGLNPRKFLEAAHRFCTRWVRLDI